MPGLCCVYLDVDGVLARLPRGKPLLGEDVTPLQTQRALRCARQVPGPRLRPRGEPRLCPRERPPTSQGSGCRGRRGLVAQQREQTLPIACLWGNTNPQPRGHVTPVRTTEPGAWQHPAWRGRGEGGGGSGSPSPGRRWGVQPPREKLGRLRQVKPTLPFKLTILHLVFTLRLKSHVHRKTCT